MATDAVNSRQDLPRVAPPEPVLRPLLVVRARVLVADDNPDIQRLFRHYLRATGAEVDTADNGRIALEMIDAADRAARPYALLLSDMQMPEVDGYTLARTLRERGSRVPVVAVTAHALSGDRARCLEAGCVDYLAKPVDAALLIAVCVQWAA